MTTEQDMVVMGKVATVFGVKGWIKVHSYAEPEASLMDYAELYIREGRGSKDVWLPLQIDQWQQHAKGLVAHVRGCDDREEAKRFAQRDIAVPARFLPELEEGEFYWHELQGLKVYYLDEADDHLLGKVDHLLETGANDVLVVKACSGSMDRRERLIPYRPEEVVLNIDLDAGTMLVDWDPEF